MRARGSFSYHQSMCFKTQVPLFDALGVLSSCSFLLSPVNIWLSMAVSDDATIHTSECCRSIVGGCEDGLSLVNKPEFASMLVGDGPQMMEVSFHGSG